MKRKIKKLKVGLVTSACLLQGFFLVKTTHAVATPNVPKPPPVDPVEVLEKFLKYLLEIGGLVAVVVIIIGGIRYIISAGNPAQAEGAKKTIIYALVGLVIMIMAFGAVQLLQLLFTATGP